MSTAAQLLSDIATKNALGARGDLSTALVNADDAAGTILYATVRFLSNTYISGEVLTLVPANLVPIGSVVAPELCTVWCNVLPGTSPSFDIGTTTDPDAYSDGLIPVALTAKRWSDSPTAPAQLMGTADAAIRVQGSVLQEPITATITISSPAACILVFRVAYIVKG